MMEKKHMSIWGVGPIFVIISCILTVCASLIHYFTYPKLSMNFLSDMSFHIIGLCFGIFGFIIWFSAAVLAKLDRKIKENKLVTTGIYAYVRNPIYSGIGFFLTGILIWKHSYTSFLLPIVFYIILRLLVRKEESILTERFGKDYLKYKETTNAVFPWVRSDIFLPSSKHRSNGR